MPVRRTYMCMDCAHSFTVVLRHDQLDDPAPACPSCSARTQQDFKPVAVHGVKARQAEAARAEALDIATKDYGITDINVSNYQGDKPKVSYKEQPASPERSIWAGPGADTIAGAIRDGRAMREQMGGSGLDVLEHNLRTGAQPDLIEVSKRRSARGW